MRNYAELKNFVPDGGLTVPIWQGSSWALPQQGVEGQNNAHNDHRRSVSRFLIHLVLGYTKIEKAVVGLSAASQRHWIKLDTYALLKCGLWGAVLACVGLLDYRSSM